MSRQIEQCLDRTAVSGGGGGGELTGMGLGGLMGERSGVRGLPAWLVSAAETRTLHALSEQTDMIHCYSIHVRYY